VGGVTYNRAYIDSIEGKLGEHSRNMTQGEATLVLRHIFGVSSANWLSRVLTNRGYPISATTIKEFRQRRAYVE